MQTLRKDAGLEVTDRIRLWLQVDSTLRDAVEIHLDTIAAEVLANNVDLAEGPDGAPAREFKVAGNTGTAALQRA